MKLFGIQGRQHLFLLLIFLGLILIQTNGSIILSQQNQNSTTNSSSSVISSPVNQTANSNSNSSSQASLDSQTIERKLADLLNSISGSNKPLNFFFKQKSQFRGIYLDKDLPIDFYSQQIYRVSGKVNYSQFMFTGIPQISSINTLQMSFINQLSQQFTFNFGTVLDGVNTQFQFDIQIKMPGNYKVKLIFNRLLAFKSPNKRTVHQNKGFSQQSKDTASEVKSLRLQIKNNYLYALWDSLSPLTILQFSQNGASNITFYLSGNHNKFQISLDRFENFTVGKVTLNARHADSQDGTYYKISSKYSSPVSIQFNACQHKVIYQSESIINITKKLPNKVKINQTIQFEAISKSNILNYYYWISPTQVKKINIDKQKLSNQLYKNGSLIKFNFTFNQTGVHYIILQENTNIQPINWPFYVGDVYPLIPDPLDFQLYSSVTQLQSQYQYTSKQLQMPILQIKQLQNNKTTSQSKINFTMRVLNSIRRKYKLQSLINNQALNKIAELNLNDIVKNSSDFAKNKVKLLSERSAKYGIDQNLLSQQLIISKKQFAYLYEVIERNGPNMDSVLDDLIYQVGVAIYQNIQKNRTYVLLLFSSRDPTKIPVSNKQLQLVKNITIQFISTKFPKVKYNIQVEKSINQWMGTDRKIKLQKFIESKKIKTKFVNQLTVELNSDWQYYLGFYSGLIINTILPKQIALGFETDKDSQNKIIVHVVCI